MARSMRTLGRHPDLVLVVVLLLLLLGAVTIGPHLYGIDPVQPNYNQKFAPPSARLPMGADQLGRDEFSRVLAGGRSSLMAGFGVVLIGGVLGSALGLVSGFYGGWLDFAIMRLTDLFLGFPALILAIAFSAAFGAGLSKGVWAAGLVWWPGYARLVRGQVLALRALPYVEAATAIGARDSRIIVRHLLPGALGEIVVKATLDIGLAVLFVASLGFLGLGAQPPNPEWGAMVSDARSFILDKWWVGFFPGLAIAATVFVCNWLGDALQPVLTPHSRRPNLD